MRKSINKKPEREDSYEFAAMRVMIQPLIDERLAQIAEYNAKPHEYSAESMKRIRGIFRRQRMWEHGKAAILWGKRVVVCFVILIALTFVACTTIEPLREKIANAFLTWYHEYVDVTFEKTSEEVILKDLTYLPEGCRLMDNQELNGHKITLYEDKNGNDLDFSRRPNDIYTTNNTSYDSEYYSIQSILINDIECILMISDDDEPHITITWEDEGCVYDIASYLSLEEVIEMVKGVK